MNKIIELISKIVFLGIGLTGIVLYKYTGNYCLLIGGAGVTIITMFDLEQYLYKYLKPKLKIKNKDNDA